MQNYHWMAMNFPLNSFKHEHNSSAPFDQHCEETIKHTRTDREDSIDWSYYRCHWSSGWNKTDKTPVVCVEWRRDSRKWQFSFRDEQKLMWSSVNPLNWKVSTVELQRNWPGRVRTLPDTPLATSPRRSSRCWWWCRQGQRKSHHPPL